MKMLWSALLHRATIITRLIVAYITLYHAISALTLLTR